MSDAPRPRQCKYEFTFWKQKMTITTKKVLWRHKTEPFFENHTESECQALSKDWSHDDLTPAVITPVRVIFTQGSSSERMSFLLLLFKCRAVSPLCHHSLEHLMTDVWRLANGFQARIHAGKIEKKSFLKLLLFPDHLSWAERRSRVSFCPLAHKQHVLHLSDRIHLIYLHHNNRASDVAHLRIKNFLYIFIFGWVRYKFVFLSQLPPLQQQIFFVIKMTLYYVLHSGLCHVFDVSSEGNAEPAIGPSSEASGLPVA